MKITILFLAFALTLTTPMIWAKAKELDTLQLCLKEAEKYQEDQVAKCYDLALPWAHSPSLMGKALYLKSLQFYLQGGSDRGFYDSIGKKLAEYYQTHLESNLTPAAIASLQNGDLETLFQALHGTHFYSLIVVSSDVALDRINLIFTEMEMRKIATDSQASELFRAFVKSNKWAEAKAVKARWKSLSQEIIPTVSVEDEVTTEDLGYYSLSSDLNNLILKKFEYKNGVKILISGDCHFAIDAFKILNQKKDFSKLMVQQGLVIGGTDYEVIDQLRKQYSNFEIHITHNPSSWFKAGVDIFIMPSFTFFKDGKRTYSFDSVSSNLVSDFCRGLKSTEMKLPQSCQSQ